MKVRAIRVIVLLWLGWYLSGPICETVDYWDGPRQEVSDVLFHAGGALVVLAAATLVGPRLLKRLRETVVSSLAPNPLCPLFVPGAAREFPRALLERTPAHSPPELLRI